MRFSATLLYMLITSIAGRPCLAMIGVQNPNRLIYTSGSAEARWIIKKECFHSDVGPSRDCDKNSSTGDFLTGSYELPPIKALHQNDFIEAAVFRGENELVLTVEEKIRYLSPKGLDNLNADLVVFESRLSKSDVDAEELESIRSEVDRLQTINEGLVRAQKLLERMNSADLETLTKFNKDWKLSEAAFEPTQKALLIFDRRQKLWIRYLGVGDYYDANGIPRVRPSDFASWKVTERGVDQSNLGGCKKSYGDAYRLPSQEELRSINRDPSLVDVINSTYSILFNDVLAFSGGYLNSPRYSISDPAPALYRSTAPIICVLKP